MNISRKLSLAAAALATGIFMYLRRRNTSSTLTGKPYKKSPHTNPTFTKIKDRHRNADN